MKNQSAPKHSVAGDITMQVLQGVVIARDFGHVLNGASPLDRHPPPPSSPCRGPCDPFEDWQIVKLMGVVLVVVAATIVTINSAAGP